MNEVYYLTFRGKPYFQTRRERASNGWNRLRRIKYIARRGLGLIIIIAIAIAICIRLAQLKGIVSVEIILEGGSIRKRPLVGRYPTSTVDNALFCIERSILSTHLEESYLGVGSGIISFALEIVIEEFEMFLQIIDGS